VGHTVLGTESLAIQTHCFSLLVIVLFNCNVEEVDSLTICDSDFLYHFFAEHCILSEVYLI
jgi:hypothetical protein